MRIYTGVIVVRVGEKIERYHADAYYASQSEVVFDLLQIAHATKHEVIGYYVLADNDLVLCCASHGIDIINVA